MATAPRFGVYGVAIQLVLALGLAVFVSAQGAGEIGPPDHLERAVVLGLLYAVPGVIAALGVRGGRPSLLVAAVVMDMAGVLLSFATLVFVVPAGLFVAHAAATAQAPIRVTAAVRSAFLGVAVVGLVVGAGFALLATTDSRCWTAYSTSSGTEYRFSPCDSQGVVELPPGAVASGGGSGFFTPRGEATAAVLVIAAIALAGFGSRRREEPVAA